MTNSNFENDDNEDSGDEEMGETNVPSGTFTVTPLEELREKNAQQLASFNELLDALSSTEDKQKALWRQIYENAITDRMNAYIIWIDLFRDVQGRPSEHGIHGQNLSRYMERMSKANDQLLKLAELVGHAKKKDAPEITEDAIYQQMENESKGLKH